MAACPAPAPVTNVMMVPGPITITLPADSDWCLLACTNLGVLLCPESERDAKNTCVERCRMDVGVDRMRPNCVAIARDVAEVRSCGVRCRRK